MDVDISELTELDIIRSSLTLVFVVITLIIGLRIISKYFTIKKKEFITVGLTLIFLSVPWWSNAFSFLSILLFGYAFEAPEYLFLLSIGIPLALIFWIYSFCKLIYPKSTNRVFIPTLIFCSAFILYLLIFLSVDLNMLGYHVEDSIFDYRRTLIPNIFAYIATISTILTGTVFALKSMRSENKEVKWKGIFFMIAIYSFVFATILDILFVGPYLILRVITRLILVFSSIAYYFGFFLPPKIASILIKDRID